MGEVHSGGRIGGAIREHGAPRRAADWLGLAAAPIFATMALVTAILGGAQAESLCAPSDQASPLHGMTAMYVLMSVFHLPPWLRLASGG